MGWAVQPGVAGVAARLRLRSGLRPSLRLRRAATPLEYRCQGDTSISANRVTFLLLDNKRGQLLNWEHGISYPALGVIRKGCCCHAVPHQILRPRMPRTL